MSSVAEPVKWAEKVIRRYVLDNKVPEMSECSSSVLLETQAGCFVTIHRKDGSLRGCIGTLTPTTRNLAEEIRANAVSSATRDPRFPPVSGKEMDDLYVTVDVLEKPQECDVEELDPQEYGVIVESGARKGVLLPNLPGVRTVADQIRIALAKAGISNKEDFRIYRFKVTRYG